MRLRAFYVRAFASGKMGHSADGLLPDFRYRLFVRRHRRMAPLPLLHVTQSAVRVTTFDGRVAGFVAIALVSALAIIWRDELPQLLRPRIRRAVSLHVAAVLVFLALLQAVLPYDHVFVEYGAISDADEATHAMHCHLTPGSCADAPISVGPGQLIFSDPLLLTAAAMLLIVVYVTGCTLHGRTLRPDLRPPVS